MRHIKDIINIVTFCALFFAIGLFYTVWSLGALHNININCTIAWFIALVIVGIGAFYNLVALFVGKSYQNNLDKDQK